MLGALVLVLGLSGCGRIGPLDLPPGSSADLAPNPRAANPTSAPPGANVVGTTETPLLGSAPPPTQPTAAPGQKRSLPIDFLLN
jgi:predicted small lipoprotein YifL